MRFCEHFLAPLALLIYKDIRSRRIMGVFIDGVALELSGSLLPLSNKMKIYFLSHIRPHLKAGLLLSYREDKFPEHEKEVFESEFAKMFPIRESQRIKGSERTIYLVRRKASEK